MAANKRNDDWEFSEDDEEDPIELNYMQVCQREHLLATKIREDLCHLEETISLMNLGG